MIMDRAARLVQGVSPRDRVIPVLRELHWLPIKARVRYKICLLTFQAVKYNKPSYLREVLRNFQPDTNMDLRHGADPYRLDEPRCNLQLGFRAFQNSAPRLYNRLPLDVKDSANIAVFKRRLKTFIFSDCFTEDDTISEMYRLT